MKKNFKYVIVGLLIVLISLTGCSGKDDGPENTVYKFIDGVNRLDIETVLECVEPSQSEYVEGMIDFIGAAAGDIDAMEFLSAVSDFYEYSGEEINQEIDFEVIEIEEDQGEAQVYGYDKNSGNEAIFYLVTIDDNWYIYELEELD